MAGRQVTQAHRAHRLQVLRGYVDRDVERVIGGLDSGTETDDTRFDVLPVHPLDRACPQCLRVGVAAFGVLPLGVPGPADAVGQRVEMAVVTAPDLVDVLTSGLEHHDHGADHHQGKNEGHGAAGHPREHHRGDHAEHGDEHDRGHEEPQERLSVLRQ